MKSEGDRWPHYFIFQVKDEEEEETDTIPQEAAVTEAFNGLVSGQEKPRPRLPEPATSGNSPARGAQQQQQQQHNSSPANNKTGGFMKHSDSSFGLHSPDSFNDDVQVIYLLNESILSTNMF